MTDLGGEVVAVYRALASRVQEVAFASPVSYVYNPLFYAWPAHEEFLRRYVSSPGRVILLGMNPGPWGMAQTGVPFGEVESVRSWLGITVEVGRPPREHPARRVLGFACHRREVSGLRLWGWARERWGKPELFFAQFSVLNYCPLMFLTSSGRNLTPDRLPAEERRPLEGICDAALRAVVQLLSPRLVVGIGGFARRRAAIALAGDGVALGEILHPSPANPRANRYWADTVTHQLQALGVEVPSRRGEAVPDASACRGG